MNEISLPKKIACVIIAIVTNFIMFSSGLTGDLSVVYTAMFLTVPTYAAMILIYPTYLYPVFPVLTVVCLYIVTDNILITILTSLFLMLSALCAEGVLQKRTKYNTIVRMSVVFFFAAIFMFVVAVYISQGYFSREAIVAFANEILEEFNNYISQLGGNVEDFAELFSQMAITIPASLLMLFAILSYFSCTLTRKIVYWFDCNYTLFNFDNYWEFEMPLETAYIYILSYTLLIFAPMIENLPTALNVAVCVVIYPLMFGMIVSGIKQVKLWLKQKTMGKGLIISLIVISTIVFFNLVLSLLSFVGVYRCFIVNKEKKWNVEK